MWIYHATQHVVILSYPDPPGAYVPQQGEFVIFMVVGLSLRVNDRIQWFYISATYQTPLTTSFILRYVSTPSARHSNLTMFCVYKHCLRWTTLISNTETGRACSKDVEHVQVSTGHLESSVCTRFQRVLSVKRDCGLRFLTKPSRRSIDETR